MRINKEAGFYIKAYSNNLDTKKPINGKLKNLSDELYDLNKLIRQKNVSTATKKDLYEIANRIYARQKSSTCHKISSFFYNLFHGRLGTTDSIYNKLKKFGVANHLHLPDPKKQSIHGEQKNSEGEEHSVHKEPSQEAEETVSSHTEENQVNKEVITQNEEKVEESKQEQQQIEEETTSEEAQVKQEHVEEEVQVEQEQVVEEEAQVEQEQVVEEEAQVEQEQVEEEEAQVEQEQVVEEEAQVKQEQIEEEEAQVKQEQIVEEEAQVKQEQIEEEEEAQVKQEQVVEEEAQVKQEQIVEEEAQVEQEQVVEEEAQVKQEQVVEEEAQVKQEQVAEEEAQVKQEQVVEEEAQVKQEQIEEEEAQVKQEQVAEEEAQVEQEQVVEEEAQVEQEQVAEEEAQVEQEQVVEEANLQQELEVQKNAESIGTLHSNPVADHPLDENAFPNLYRKGMTASEVRDLAFEMKLPQVVNLLNYIKKFDNENYEESLKVIMKTLTIEEIKVLAKEDFFQLETRKPISELNALFSSLDKIKVQALIEALAHKEMDARVILQLITGIALNCRDEFPSFIDQMPEEALTKLFSILKLDHLRKASEYQESIRIFISLYFKHCLVLQQQNQARAKILLNIFKENSPEIFNKVYEICEKDRETVDAILAS